MREGIAKPESGMAGEILESERVTSGASPGLTVVVTVSPLNLRVVVPPSRCDAAAAAAS